MEKLIIPEFNQIEKIYKNDLTKNTLIQRIKLTFSRTIFCLYNLIDGTSTGLERNDINGLINPLLWEFGHVIFFWQEMTCKYLNIQTEKLPNNIYDSALINREDRWTAKLCNIKKLNNIYISTLKTIIEYIKNNKLNNINSYLIQLSQLHNEMHIESFIFSHQVLMKPICNLTLKNIINSKKYRYIKERLNGLLEYPIHDQKLSDFDILNDIEFIKVKSAYLNQGFSKTGFSFDNERPSFSTNIESFNVSKYCITNYQYLQFVSFDGYDKKKYWSDKGWEWKENNSLSYPKYWFKDNNIFYEKIFDKKIKLRLNNPVTHISHFEASAYCKWKGGRLLKEKEWEYLSNQFKNKNQKKNAILDYQTCGTISVLKDPNINDFGIVGLFGNVWEWCQEYIYPYDNFEIDPIYREMSYPTFNKKRICRGGCWAVPKELITSTYRNAQVDGCTWQYIGFRIAKD